jgi:hypothetical protein
MEYSLGSRFKTKGTNGFEGPRKKEAGSYPDKNQVPEIEARI